MTVFEVGHAERVSQTLDRWLLRGRAYEEIRLGDVLRCEPGTEVRVVAVASYGLITDLLSRMMTGDLVVIPVEFADSNDLTNVRFLVRGPQ